MDSTVTVSAGGFIEHSTDLYTEISIFIRRIQHRLLVTIAALSHMEDFQKFMKLIFTAKGANHDCFFTVGQLFESQVQICV